MGSRNSTHKGLSSTQTGISSPTTGEGIKSIQTTGVFRAVNFELYVKPVSFMFSGHEICIKHVYVNFKSHIGNNWGFFFYFD